MAGKQQKRLVLGGVEAGGTSFTVTIAHDEPTNIVKRHNFKTTTPKETLAKAAQYFQENPVDALGIACFGPIDIRPHSKTYGYITSTPKPNWPNTDVLGAFRELKVPIGFNTDVVGAALGELRHGKHGDISACCYVTVGTGVGVGVVSHNRPVEGPMHTEGGHFYVPRYPGDKYVGNCPYHKDCLEGLVNAKALADRLNMSPDQLKALPDSHEIWNIAAFYLAQLCCTLTLLTCPEVIVLGGGVLQRKCLFPRIRALTVKLLNGYIQVKRVTEETDRYITPSVFDPEGGSNNAGSVGALELARLALARESKAKEDKAALRSAL